MSQHSYIEIAGNASLWFRYFPPTHEGADWQFKRMSLEEKIGMLMCTYGPDPHFDTLVNRAADEGLVGLGNGLWLSNADMLEMMLERFPGDAGTHCPDPLMAPYWLLKQGESAPKPIFTGFDLAAALAVHNLLKRRPAPVAEDTRASEWEQQQAAA